MTEVSTKSLREYFHCINGGITMCRSRLSNYLVEQGLDGYYRAAHEISNHSPSITLRNDHHFLRLGVEALDSEKLRSCIAPLKELHAQIGKLDDEYRSCTENIKKAEEQWQVVAERAKHQLAVWIPWVIEAETTRIERSGPWRGSELLRVIVSLNYDDSFKLIESPQQLQKNLAFFQKQTGSIRTTISTAYLANELPKEWSVYDLDMALDALLKHQAQLNELESRKVEVAEKVESAKNAYFIQKDQLDMLLCELSDIAQWALFLICNQTLLDSNCPPHSPSLPARAAG